MIELYRPKIEDLWFRQKLMEDEETMSYNRAWGGTIPFPESEWKDWYDHWVLNDEGKRFYRYLKDSASGEFVGEVAWHLDGIRLIWIAGVIIDAEYRGRGYGKEGLRLLCESAEDRGIKILCDDVAIDDPAVPLLEKNGFTEEYRTDEVIMLKKDLRDSL